MTDDLQLFLFNDMTSSFSILAEDFDGWGKLIGFGIVAVFWGIHALSSVIKKAGQQTKQNAATLPRVVVPQAAAAAQPAKQVAMRPAAAARQQQAGQRKAAVKRAASTAANAPPPLPADRAPAARQANVPANAAAAPMKAVQSPRQSGATAATIRKWLEPDTVRRQFILTELFQPPLALRQPSEPRQGRP